MLLTFEAALRKMSRKLKVLHDDIISFDRSAKRFVFDTQTIPALVAIENDQPQLVIDQMSAPMPFDRFTLQLPMRSLLLAMRDSGTKFTSGDVGDTLHHLTYLVTPSKNVYIAGYGKNVNDSFMIPIMYQIDSYDTQDLLICSGIRELLSGSDHLTDDDIAKVFVCGSLSSKFDDMHSQFSAIPRMVIKQLVSEGPELELTLIHEIAGQLRYLFSALAIMQMQKSCIFLDAPPARVRVGNKYQGQPGYRKVTIKLDSVREELAYEAYKRSYTHHRQHDVRGHWVHFSVDIGCEHTWIDIAGVKIRQYCALCKGRRTFRAAHTRGDPALGVITNEYRVKG